MIKKKNTSRTDINSSSAKNKLSLLGIVEAKIFQNKNNKQFNLPVIKRSTSPQIIQDILGNSDVVGIRFKITDVILKNNIKGLDIN